MTKEIKSFYFKREEPQSYFVEYLSRNEVRIFFCKSSFGRDRFKKVTKHSSQRYWNKAPVKKLSLEISNTGVFGALKVLINS